MSEISSRIISKKIQPTGFAMFSVWLLIILVPLLFMLVAANLFVEEYADYMHAEVIQKAYRRLELFRERLIPDSYLERRVDQLVNLMASSGSPEELKFQIDKILGATSLFCAFFDADVTSVKTASTIPEDIKGRHMPPAVLLRRVLQSVINRPIPTTEEEIDIFERDKFRDAAQMQQFFAAMTHINVETNKISKNFSVQLGGEIYLILIKFAKPVADVAGALILVRGCEIPAKLLIDDAQDFFEDCRVIGIDYDLKNALADKGKFISGVNIDEGQLRVLMPPDQLFTRHYLHRGGIMIAEDRQYIPWLKFEYDFAKDRQELTEYAALFRLAILIIILVSGVWLLHAYLFGLNFDSGFRFKILVVIIAASAFPFSAFAATLYVHQHYAQFVSRLNLLQHLEGRFSKYNDALLQYQARLETISTAVTAEAFKGVDLSSKQQVRQVVKSLLQSLPATKLSLFTLDGRVVESEFSRVSKVKADSSADFIMNFLAQNVLRAVRHDPDVDGVDYDKMHTFSLAGNEVRSSSLNQILIVAGKMLFIQNEFIPQWIAMQPVATGASKSSTAEAILLTTFEPGPILKEFFANAEVQELVSDEEFGNYQISYSYIPNEETGARRVWGGFGDMATASESFVDEINETISLAGEVLLPGREYFIKRLNRVFPHTILARIKQVSSDGIEGLNIVQILLAGFAYLLLVFAFADQLFRKMFFVPALAMAESAAKVARGEENWNLELKTGDEFSELNQNFIKMIQGLQQRNLLKDYVAAEAITEASSHGKLSPGGETRQVTVLFISFTEPADFTGEPEAEEMISRLNYFIGVADEEARTFMGVIDKIIENSIMLVFRAESDTDSSHAPNALHAASRIANRMRLAGFGINAGIASGNVISGRIGSYKGMLDYTVIGDTVNLAARLRLEAKNSSSGIIISGATMRLLRGCARVSFLRRCRLKGKAREYNIYEFSEFRQ